MARRETEIKFDLKEVALLAALVAQDTDPDLYSDGHVKALIYRCRAMSANPPDRVTVVR